MSQSHTLATTPWEILYIYIYIYSHPQTHCFVVSQFLSVARHVGRSKLGSKPAQLYIRLTAQPTSEPRQLRNYQGLSCSFRLFTGYQSAEFVQRALHYVAAVNSFVRVLNPRWEAYILLSTDRLFPYITTPHIYHHHVVPLAQISLTLSRHISLSFTASGRSSGLHPVSSHSCCMYVLAGRPALARPYVGVHRST